MMAETSDTKTETASRLQKYQQIYSPSISLRSCGYEASHRPLTGSEVESEAGNVPFHPYPWRNNLTGLSRRYNLYFIAIQDEIHVHRIDHASQQLTTDSGRTPLRYKLIPSRPGLAGHMPRRNPHAVNNLLVAELGTAEILCYVCDDGDVEAVYTHKFEEAMRMREKSKVPNDNVPLSVQSFFHLNVGSSAWGLAVHAEQHLIAVSANNHLIHVFAFARASSPDSNSDLKPASDLDSDSNLESEPEPESEPESESDSNLNSDSDADPDSEIDMEEEPLEHHWVQAPESTRNWLKDRRRNQFRLLRNHWANIPCIAFDDIIGCPHLVTSDISGRVVVWTVSCGSTWSTLQSHHDIDAYDAMRAGWSLICLNTRSFNKANTLVEALGACEISKQGSISLIDISHGKHLISDNKTWNALKSHQSDRRSSAPIIDTVTELSSPTSESDDDTEMPDESTAGESDGTLNDAANKAIDLLKKNVRGDIQCLEYAGMEPHDCDNTGAFPLFFSQSETSPFFGPPLYVWTGPLLLCNPQAIHLFQSLDLTTNTEGQVSPIVYLNDPLEQHTRPDLNFYLSEFDRLNLSVQIPGLGIVLVGSGKGRVAVLSLHQLDESVKGVSKIHSHRKLYTMKLAALLPSSEDEASGRRPFVPLIGIAAAPMPGHGNGKGPILNNRKYCRVMLTYQNLTVLSYEISRDHFENTLHV